jgi:hypothetical protein
MTEDKQRAEGSGQGAGDGRFFRWPMSFIHCPLLLAVILMLFSACGVKGEPFLTEQKVLTVKVEQLRGVWDDKDLALNGLVQGGDDSLSLITGCRVHYIWYSSDQPPCEGCPIEMTSFRDISGQIISDGQFSCELPLFQQKGICFVTVRLMGKAGLQGPSSSRIKLISDL